MVWTLRMFLLWSLCVVRILLMLFSLTASAKGQQEITITAAQSQYCFDGLSPDSEYSATVFVQTPNLEGPGVSTKERTREDRCLILLYKRRMH